MDYQEILPKRKRVDTITQVQPLAKPVSGQPFSQTQRHNFSLGFSLNIPEIHLVPFSP